VKEVLTNQVNDYPPPHTRNYAIRIPTPSDYIAHSPYSNTAPPPRQHTLKVRSWDATKWQAKSSADIRNQDFSDEPVAPPKLRSSRRANTIPPPTATAGANNTSKPTCSLNLICYRPGRQGCVLRQIQVISRARFHTDEDYNAAVKQNEGIVWTDVGLFKLLYREYNGHMCGFWRRYLSLETLRQVRLLTVSKQRYCISQETYADRRALLPLVHNYQ
jgi:hypothetical protein